MPESELAVGKQPEQPASPAKTYRARVPIARQTVRLRKACVIFYGVMSADDFFDGLERVGASPGTHFQKESKEISIFPDLLTVDLTAELHKSCKPPWTAERPYLEANVMRTIRFKAQWKRGAILRDVDSISAEEHKPVWDESGNKYGFRIRIISAGVPLTDELVLSASLEGVPDFVRISVVL